MRMPQCLICHSSRVEEVHKPQITSGESVSFSYTFSPEHSKTLGVYGCTNCTHQFCHPVPADIGVNYKEVVDEEYLKHDVSRKLAARKLLSKLTKYRTSGKLVDIGCATGDFLEEAEKAGFDAEGIEPSAWSSKISTERGFVVHQELLAEFADKHPQEYDVATLWGVIEHFADPAAEVARIQKILKPGGLFLIWTGDVDSITSQLLGRKWWYWQGQHIQYFTKKSLERLLTESGFEVVANKLYPFAASYETLHNSLKRYRSHGLLTKMLKPIFAAKPTWYLYLPGEMFVIARKI